MEKVFRMELRKVYPLLVAKAERKGRSRAEVDEVTCWLTGYNREDLAALVETDISYGDFFRGAPAPNTNRLHLRGEGGSHPGPAAAGHPRFGQAGGRAG